MKWQKMFVETWQRYLVWKKGKEANFAYLSISYVLCLKPMCYLCNSSHFSYNPPPPSRDSFNWQSGNRKSRRKFHFRSCISHLTVCLTASVTRLPLYLYFGEHKTCDTQDVWKACRQVRSKHTIKGTVSWDFWLQVFDESSSPGSPIVPVTQFRFFSKASEIFATRNSKCTTDREFGIIYRGPGLLAVEWLAPPPIPPSPVGKSSLFISLPVCCLLTRKGWGG